MIDNPDYVGAWAPRKIPNPDYFEDSNPAKFNKIGGLGFEIWTMTEDIMFDNIYLGHSPEDAKALAAESFHVKHAAEKAVKDAEAKAEKDEAEAAAAVQAAKDSVLGQLKQSFATFQEDPVAFIRDSVVDFVDAVKENPKEAFKAQPQVAATILVTLLTFFAAVLALFGFIGSEGKTVSKVGSLITPTVQVLTKSIITVYQKDGCTFSERQTRCQGRQDPFNSGRKFHKNRDFDNPATKVVLPWCSSQGLY